MDSYDLGEGFGHFGLAAGDVYKMVDAVKAKGAFCVMDDCLRGEVVRQG